MASLREAGVTRCFYCHQIIFDPGDAAKGYHWDCQPEQVVDVEFEEMERQCALNSYSAYGDWTYEIWHRLPTGEAAFLERLCDSLTEDEVQMALEFSQNEYPTAYLRRYQSGKGFEDVTG